MNLWQGMKESFYLTKASFEWRSNPEDVQTACKALDEIVQYAQNRRDPHLLLLPLDYIMQKFWTPDFVDTMLDTVWEQHQLDRFRPQIKQTDTKYSSSF